MAKRLTIKQFAAGSCYSYIVSAGRDAVIIDPHISLLDTYSAFIDRRKLALTAIIDTHTHADHFSLAAVLKKKYGAPLIMSDRAVSAIVNRRVKDGETITFGEGSLAVLATPGHTDDAISLSGGGAIFTGDALLIGSVGRTDFQSGSPESMFDTLARLKQLPDAARVYPGHDYHGARSSTIGAEKRSNPFMREADRKAFIAGMRAKVLPKPFAMDTIIRVNQSGQAAAIAMIAPEKAHELIEQDGNTVLLDVRAASEYAEVRIKDALHIPLDTLAGRLAELSGSGHDYIVFCRTGSRSPMAADMLMQAGIHGVKVLDGGMDRWVGAKLPVIRGEAVFSIERQVRLAAGSCILAGLLLARFAHPAFIIIPFFVSCGLIFSGATDSCLMGVLLMKLPYNRKMLMPKTGGGTCAMG